MLTKQQVLEKPNTLTFKIPQGMRAGQALFNFMRQAELIFPNFKSDISDSGYYSYYENMYEKDTAEIQEMYDKWLYDWKIIIKSRQ